MNALSRERKREIWLMEYRYISALGMDVHFIGK